MINTFLKNRVGGREVNLNLDNVFKYTVFLRERVPLSMSINTSAASQKKMKYYIQIYVQNTEHFYVILRENRIIKKNNNKYAPQ